MYYNAITRYIPVDFGFTTCCVAVMYMYVKRYMNIAYYFLVRLVGNVNSLEGRLEILYDGLWGTVCANGVTGATAKVVCYMLGHGYLFSDVGCI